MGAKEDLIAAARSLHDQGRDQFSLVEIVDEARRLGCTYPDVTLRTMVSHHLRIDKGVVAGGVGFIQVSRGSYRLGSSDGDPVAKRTVHAETSARATSDLEARVPPSNGGHEWFWEGNIQAVLVHHLVNDGWRIRRVADTHSREHGVDIEADRSGVQLLVEVKGYPTSTYLTGPNEGQKKNFGVGAQARTYFGNAVLAGLLMRSDNADARIVLVFPALETFKSLARRAAHPLGLAEIEIWLVDVRGQVTNTNPGATAPSEHRQDLVNEHDEFTITGERSKYEWRPEDVVILESDDVNDDDDKELL